MSNAASAVTDLIAPAPPPAPAAARDDHGPSFQSHLDAADSATHPSEPPTRSPTPTNNAKAANSSSQDNDATQAAANSADTANEERPADATGKTDKATHPVLVQVLPEGNSPEPRSETTPTPPAPQQPHAQQAPAAVASPQSDAPLIAQTADAKPQSAPPIEEPSTQKPNKTDAKTTKEERAALEPPQAINSQQPPQAAAPQVAPVAPTAASIQTTNSAPQTDDAIGAIEANGQRATAPVDHAPARTTPQAAPSTARDASKGDEPKTDVTRAAKPASAAPTTRSALDSATTPDLKDLVRGASAGSGDRAPSAAVTTMSATQTQAPVDSASSDFVVARAEAAPLSSQVAREIVRRANGENTRFELRLDPPELGKIQVQLDISRDHKVTAVVSADNPQALSDLSRGARDLQQALQSAGLDLADDGLSFNLSNSQNGFSQPDQSNSSGEASASARSQAASNQPSADATAPRARPFSIESWRGARIDVMA